ncbi:MAG TPA: PAS domain S-box protein [Thermodesulfobacteriota bacterium]|nr:PAS domain S-box protein [Thermodesulfobacteriota bacterium]
MKEKLDQPKREKRSLRKLAEEILAEKSESLDKYLATDIQKLIHELRVYQIELEMQNEELRRAQAELEESRNKYADLYDFAPVGYFTLGKKGIIEELNLSSAALLGLERKYLIKRPLSAYIDREHHDAFYFYLEQLVKSPTKHTCELRMVRRDGTFYAQLEGVAVLDGRGKFNHIKIAILDITQRKKAEETLRQNLTQLARKNRYQLIVNSVIQRVHRSINLQDVLENAVEFMHQNIDEAHNVSIYFVEGKEAVIKASRGYPGWFIDRVGRIPYPRGLTWKTIIEGKPLYCSDTDQDNVIGPAGREVGTKSYASMPIHFEGKAIGAININSLTKNAFDEEEISLLDVIAQQIEIAINNAKRAEALRESEERFRTMADSAPVMIWMSGIDKLCTYFNRGWLVFRGTTMEEELGNGWAQRVHPDDRERCWDIYANKFDTRDEFKMEYRLRRYDGVYRWILDHGIPRFLHDGTFVGYIGSCIDITERKEAEERFRLVVESAPYATVTTDKRGKITYVNPQTERLFGYNREELIGQSVEILVPERFRKEHPEYRRDFHKDPQARPVGAGRYLYALRKDGSEFPVEIGLTPIKTGDGLLVLSSIVDITQRKRAEQALRESEEKLRAIMDNTTDAILVYDESGNIVTANREVEKLFGGDGIKELKSIWDIVPPEEKANFAHILRSVKEGNKLVDYETERIVADGERIPVSLALAYVNEASGAFISTIRDIRERVALRNKIVDFEKAQIFGKMAEGIAHHMGTPLASMLLRVQMLKEDVQEIPKHGKLMEKLDSIERQIFYGQKVMQRLLKFASKPEGIRQPEKVSVILEDASEMIKPLLRKPGIKLDLSGDKDVKVKADIDLLELVFSDLMMNAVDAMPEGGTISIDASKEDSEQMVKIAISDTGTGIPQEVLPYVFEPFFTTKPAGKGTGLGLSVAKRIVQGHDGEISIESSEGRGTSVFIKLPTYTEVE